MTRKLLIAAIGAVLFAGPAYAIDHGCGVEPEKPVLFDSETAIKDDVLAARDRFQAYQAANGTYLDCIAAYAKSAEVTKLGRGEREAAIATLNNDYQAGQDHEAAVVDEFNNSAKAWVAKQQANAGQ